MENNQVNGRKCDEKMALDHFVKLSYSVFTSWNIISAPQAETPSHAEWADIQVSNGN